MPHSRKEENYKLFYSKISERVHKSVNNIDYGDLYLKYIPLQAEFGVSLKFKVGIVEQYLANCNDEGTRHYLFLQDYHIKQLTVRYGRYRLNFLRIYVLLFLHCYPG